MKGRKPIPTETLKLTGGYREDRHGGRADAVPVAGTPIKPNLEGEAAGLWERVVPDLIRRGLVGESDTAELTRLCEFWGLYRAAYELAKVDPCDKDLRCSVKDYGAEFGRLASKFGLTTADRAALKIAAPQKKSAVPMRVRA